MQMIHVGVLKTFDNVAYTASVQLVPSTTTYFDEITVARNVDAPEMIPGRHVIIVAPGDNPKDAVVIGVFTP